MLMRLFGRRSCADVAAVLDGYCERSLDPQLDGIVERHLQRCADCAALARTYRETIELTGELPAEEIPASVRRRAHDAFRERVQRKLRDGE